MSKQSIKMLPAARGTCCMCARDHAETYPHDFESVFYQVRFRLKYGRDATQADAAAHCDEQIRQAWKQILREQFGVEWTQPRDGAAPIAEPYAKVE